MTSIGHGKDDICHCSFQPSTSDTSITIGIDVSKDHLDAARYPSGDTTRVANTRKGHTVLLRWISSNDVARVVFEATGPYHRGLEQRLDAAGLTIAKINPRQARRFAHLTPQFTAENIVGLCPICV